MHDDESTWIIQAQQGNSQAFGFLVEKYQRPVYNLCYRMLSNAEDAEDAAQESFFRAYKALKRYDRSRAFSTWLLSIAAHYCIDQIRRRRFQVVSVEDLPYQDIPDTEPGDRVHLFTQRAAKAYSCGLRCTGCHRPGGSCDVLLVRFFLRRNCRFAFFNHECCEKSSA